MLLVDVRQHQQQTIGWKSVGKTEPAPSRSSRTPGKQQDVNIEEIHVCFAIGKMHHVLMIEFCADHTFAGQFSQQPQEGQQIRMASHKLAGRGGSAMIGRFTAIKR